MSQVAEAVKAELVERPKIKLDIGCGPNPREGYVGVDSIDFGKNLVADLRHAMWVFSKPHESMVEISMGHEVRYKLPDNSVEAANCSHFLEHLTNLDDRWERVKFWNELWRVMMPDAVLNLILPHWCSARYYGDPTHKEPWSEWAFLYLDKNWRASNAPHADAKHNANGYCCDWEYTVGYGVHPEFQPKNATTQQFALQFYKDAATDIIATMKPRKGK
jgi:SAM-dependent methyltransferase